MATQDPASPEGTIDLSDPDFYINRELSILAFNLRVLEQALDDAHPLLERLGFLRNDSYHWGVRAPARMACCRTRC